MSKGLSEDAIFSLLSLVEQYPVLWDTRRDDYANTDVKASVWLDIAGHMLILYPQFAPYTIDGLKNIFQNKRRTFRQERKKVVSKSGHPAEDVYLGKWKFFSSLRFLEALTKETSALSVNDDFQDGEEMDGESVISSDPNDQVPPSPVLSLAPSPTPSERTGPCDIAVESYVLKRNEDGLQLCALEERPSTPKKPAQAESLTPDDCAAFGSVVAEYLRHMPLASRARCQAAILSLIPSFLQE